MTTRPVETPEERRARLKEFGQKLQIKPSQPLEFELRSDLPSFKNIQYKALPYPKQCRIATLNSCSAACTWCHGYGEGREMDGVMMPFNLIVKIVDEIATWPEPLYEIVPIGFGEFFLRKDWHEVLLYISDKLPKTRIWIPTNGSVLTPQAVERLAQIKTLRGLNLSVNATFQETYVKTMKLPPWVMRRCEEIAVELHRLRPDVTLWASMVYTPLLITELEKDLFIEKWSAYKFVHPQVLNASSAGLEIFGPNWPKEPVTLPCRSIFTDMVIHSDGRVLSCCWDAGNTKNSLDLGNVSGSTLLEQWRGSKFERLRDIHNEGKRAMVPLCRSCTFA